jgi:hypothetical protein
MGLRRKSVFILMLPSHRILDKQLISLDPLFQHYSRSLRSAQSRKRVPSFQHSNTPKAFLPAKPLNSDPGDFRI